jgi:hypothetical protein
VRWNAARVLLFSGVKPNSHQGERNVTDQREQAQDTADQGLDKIIEGDVEKGRQLIDEAKKRDPKAVEDLATEVERDRDQTERFIDKK